MANVIIFDTETKRVKKYLKSVHTPDYSERADVIVNPSLPYGVAIKYWKVDNGKIVEMSQAEKDTIDTAEVEAATAAQEALKDVDNYSLAIKVSNYVTLKLINQIREKVGLTEYTWNEYKEYWKEIYEGAK